MRISPTHRVPGYENYATFQPVFLYQSLCAAGYAAGGIWVETLRVGPVPHALGMRYGALGDIAVFVLAVLGMYTTRLGRRPPARAQAK